jgi:hypothetical protein
MPIQFGMKGEGIRTGPSRSPTRSDSLKEPMTTCREPQDALRALIDDRDDHHRQLCSCIANVCRNQHDSLKPAEDSQQRCKFNESSTSENLRAALCKSSQKGSSRNGMNSETSFTGQGISGRIGLMEKGKMRPD